jgi:hypothetical protein
MQTINKTMLDTIVGGQSTTCPITNRMEHPLYVYPDINSNERFTLGPGQTGAVPPGEFTVIPKAPAAGAHGGDCMPGRSFKVTRYAPHFWANTPDVTQ